MGCHYMVISTPLVTKEYISTVSPVLFFWLCHPTENLWPLNISGLWDIIQTISMALKDFPQCNHTIVSQSSFSNLASHTIFFPLKYQISVGLLS